MENEFRYYTLNDAFKLIWRWKLFIIIILIIVSILVVLIDSSCTEGVVSMKDDSEVLVMGDSKSILNADLDSLKDILERYSLEKKIFLADFAAFIIAFLFLLIIDPFVKKENE